ncbi:xanthine dehydrogenase family protein molybdopterin-binding subunit [Shewanella avicenniae]|uniref:Xanthine dehydrogenase family protein molybdopterin-binding subunit n=1 Tax=Shewanella avicenniae TaxID=2814294 RepID=A0ABX7QPF1_9GAMM|nr:molybdopterin cofactor-binding domain-containing protein [Shewanella avicenniae]QSX33264.1 xanthine dehydrogenase family protein molybdopterin-binding subunit [Shewanella avicenniae]
MKSFTSSLTDAEFAELTHAQPVNVSRRQFLLSSAGLAAGALVLSVGLPLRQARAAEAKPMAAGTRVPAFLQITPDNRILLQSPFVEGGQGIFTAMAQIVGEELDADPASFIVENAPTGPDFKVMIAGPGRITGGSMSVRFSYPVMRKLGALARQMLLQAAAAEWKVAIDELATEPGKVVHGKTQRSLSYGELAIKALDLAVPDPDSVSLKDPKDFRWIGKGVARVDVYEKSTGKAEYTIDIKADGMLHAAVQHAPRLGMTAAKILNQAQVEAMYGVHSVHILAGAGAVAVVAEHWWNAKRAVEAVQVEWLAAQGAEQNNIRHMPADFSSEAFSELLAKRTEPGDDAETKGEAVKLLNSASPEALISATYRTQYVHHAQLEPPSALAQFHPDGSLEVWLPNQAPDMFLADIAKRSGLTADKVTLHSPILGGFFGRHFLYPAASPYPQAIELAKAVGKPVKVIWSREEEFLRDPLRPMAAVRLRAEIKDNKPVALEAISSCEGPSEGIYGRDPNKVDGTAVEGLSGKSYAIPNVRIARDYVKNPTMLAYWRSVGNSMNDFVYECFLDEMADKAGVDPYQFRKQLLQDNPRLSHLLEVVVASAGGWQRGPFTAEDGTKRARGIAMASPFGTEAAAIAEVSIEHGQVRVHHVWEAVDPGSIVNPAIIEAQVNSAVALGLSQVLMEEVVYKKGKPLARNYDMYPILRPDEMAKVHVSIVESGAKMGGIGEPGLPAIPPAVVNAVSQLLGRRIRTMPLSRSSLED